MRQFLRWAALVAATGCAVHEPPATAELAQPSALPPRSWRPATPAPFPAVAPLLLTDGTVMVQELDTENWWRLAPDAFGSYASGSWTPLASMPTGYSPLYTASAVLPDGRVIVEGGEYIAGVETWTTRGALYDPVADAWTEVRPPLGWTTIGDASGIVLANGRFMLSDCCSKSLALLEPNSLTWVATGAGKADINDEESWAQLPDNTLLTVDANNLADLTASELYDPHTGMWSLVGDTPYQITDTAPDGSGSHEVGPEVLRPDGTVLALGGNGHNVVYDTATTQWSAAPDLPIVGGEQLQVADGPGAVLPNGDVLLVASPGVFQPGSHFYEWNGTAFTDVAGPPNAPANSSYNQFMLLLPTGELLLTDFTSDVELYTPAPGVVAGTSPVITAISEPLASSSARVELAQPTALERPVTSLYLGRTYRLEGTRLSGISQGAYYGDDLQASTNYPIVRLTATDTRHVTYCRSHHHSDRSIAPDARGTTQFDVPTTAERGLAVLEVIANGIASPPVLVNVK